MNTSNFISLLKHPQDIKKADTVALKSILHEYPFFQAARAIYLKGLKNEESFKYNSELKTTAAYTSDRTILFDFITSEEFITSLSSNKEEETHQQLSERITVTQPSIVESELGIGKPIQFTETEKYSFNQWLQLSSNKKIVRTENKDPLIFDKAALIDNFIKKNPSISQLDKGKEYQMYISDTKTESTLMTETLANVYLEQKKYKNAIKAYEVLSLKYPEKSGFFADQIKRVKILQKHTS